MENAGLTTFVCSTFDRSTYRICVHLFLHPFHQETHARNIHLLHPKIPRSDIQMKFKINLLTLYSDLSPNRLTINKTWVFDPDFLV